MDKRNTMTGSDTKKPSAKESAIPTLVALGRWQKIDGGDDDDDDDTVD